MGPDEWAERDQLESKNPICRLKCGSFFVLMEPILKEGPLNLEMTENKRMPEPRTGERL